MSVPESNYFSCRKLLYSLFFVLLIIFSVNLRAQTTKYEGMVVSADSIATEVGVQILKEGGNAVDAAVAVGFALAVTYPVAGNIGGGGFMVLRTASGEEITIDYREKAPAAATRDMYLDEQGEVNHELATEGILSAGVPGSVYGMLEMLKKYGTMPREKVIAPAIKLAREGFALPVSTAHSFEKYYETFLKFPSTSAIFTKDGELFQPGDIFKQTDLANTLERISKFGIEGFYEGETADLIVKQMQTSSSGIITKEDLAGYRAIERKPVIGNYRGYKIISMAPPSSGGVALIEMLNILENHDLKSYGHNSPEYIRILAETMRRAYADRSKYLGDPDFYDIPVEELTSKEYGKQLFNEIGDRVTPSEEVEPGLTNFFESSETTHYSILDGSGNAVSVTTTINSGYGSKVVVKGAGFFLNNEMDDFSAKPGVPNQFGLLGNEANSIQPGKRMLSSMTPTIVLKDGKPFLIVGTPGGSTIITSVLQVILNAIDFDMDVERAVNTPFIHHQWYPDVISVETGAITEETAEKLIEMGYHLTDIEFLGLMEAIRIDPATGKVTGASDRAGAGLAKGVSEK